uniref:Uncharacterized protein n=1 Tax=Laticauda laticaudata TaxID=8630 RepID=A0A8C5SHX1_LATLA
MPSNIFKLQDLGNLQPSCSLEGLASQELLPLGGGALPLQGFWAGVPPSPVALLAK